MSHLGSYRYYDLFPLKFFSIYLNVLFFFKLLKQEQQQRVSCRLCWLQTHLVARDDFEFLILLLHLPSVRFALSHHAQLWIFCFYFFVVLVIIGKCSTIKPCHQLRSCQDKWCCHNW